MRPARVLIVVGNECVCVKLKTTQMDNQEVIWTGGLAKTFAVCVGGVIRGCGQLKRAKRGSRTLCVFWKKTRASWKS
jgi:hypothetical protein